MNNSGNLINSTALIIIYFKTNHPIVFTASNTNKFQDEPNTPDANDGLGEFPMSQSFMNLSIEEQEIKKEEWRKELAEVTFT